MACTRHDTFFISHTCRHACVHKIDDVETLVQSTHVLTRRVAEARMHVSTVHAKSGLHASWRKYKLNKNTLGVKKVRGQSEAALQIGMYDQKL